MSDTRAKIGPYGDRNSPRTRMRVPAGWRVPPDTRYWYGGVYFVQGEDGGLIKIGHSTCISRRVSEHQEGCPVVLRVIGAIRDADRGREYDLHGRFHSARVQGEWFEPTPELLAYIAGLADEAAA